MNRYYKILDKGLVARRENYLSGSIFVPGEGWKPDTDHILSDRLIGYDGEGIGSTDMLTRIEEITEEEALKLIS